MYQLCFDVSTYKLLAVHWTPSQLLSPLLAIDLSSESNAFLCRMDPALGTACAVLILVTLVGYGLALCVDDCSDHASAHCAYGVHCGGLATGIRWHSQGCYYGSM